MIPIMSAYRHWFHGLPGWISIALLIFCLSGCQEVRNSDPIIVFTFDDGDKTIYENAYRIMKDYDFEGTLYLNSGSVGLGNDMTIDRLHEMYNDGWEIGGHTIDHVNLPDFTYEEAKYQIEEDYNFFRKQGFVMHSFALPSGHATPEHFDLINDYYSIIRTSLDLSMRVPVNQEYLGYFYYQTDYRADDVIQRIIHGVNSGEDLIIIGFHRVFENIDWSYPDVCQIHDFIKIMDFVKDRKFTVQTVHEAINTLKK